VKDSSANFIARDYSHYVTYRVSQLNAGLNTHAARLLKEQCGLSLVQWRLLALVAGAEPVTSAQLVDAIAMDSGQFSRNLKALIQDGLIISTVDKADHRRHLLSLSKEGRGKFNSAEPVMRERREALLSGVSAADKAAFFRTLDQLERNLQPEPVSKSYA